MATRHKNCMMVTTKEGLECTRYFSVTDSRVCIDGHLKRQSRYCHCGISLNILLPEINYIKYSNDGFTIYFMSCTKSCGESTIRSSKAVESMEFLARVTLFGQVDFSNENDSRNIMDTVD